MNKRVQTQVPLRIERLRCLYISRYAPIRTQTDPYTGLPWHLSQQTSLRGIWSKPERGTVPFRETCKEVIEVPAGIKGWLSKLGHAWAETNRTAKSEVVVCGVDEHSLSLAVLVGKMAGIPVYACAEDPPFTNRYNGFSSVGRRIERELRRKLISILLERCKGVFCFVEKEALKDFNIHGVPLHQMMNGPSEKALTWSEESPRPTEQNGNFVVGLVGALCKEQGLDTLLEIIAEAGKRIGSLKLRLIGPMHPDYEEAFYEQARRLALESSIELTGWLSYPKMLEQLSGCSLGVYCNPDTDWFRVAQPLKICEYLALAKPVIAWDYPGTRRLLDQGRLGVLVPSGDVSAFADALVRLRDPAVRAGIEKEIRIATACQWSNTYWYEEALRIMQQCVGGNNT
jgi:glycosyltransferase involved in cell wall biosynthesis